MPAFSSLPQEHCIHIWLQEMKQKNYSDHYYYLFLLWYHGISGRQTEKSFPPIHNHFITLSQRINIQTA